MRKRDVPQEGNATLGGHRKAVYAVGEDGKLRIVRSRGWEVEEVVTRQAVEDLERRAREARSPLEYHMYRARMDVAMLAAAAGIWRWRVRRHLRPQAFARLPVRLRRRYAEALGVPLAALERID
ncbi:MAG TPA: hypothetical protein VLI89_06015 [Burkholderiales bacterium]|jgi:hypothetical protein|nr:hypothetical protein [Burkholderiales bacterium]